MKKGNIVLGIVSIQKSRIGPSLPLPAAENPDSETKEKLNLQKEEKTIKRQKHQRLMTKEKLNLQKEEKTTKRKKHQSLMSKDKLIMLKK